MIRQFFVLTLITFCLLSCSNKKDNSYFINKLESELNIRIPTTFKVLEYRSDAAIGGDYTEEFILQFEKHDFEIILNSLDTSSVKKVNNEELLIFNKSINSGESIGISFSMKEYIIQYVYVFN